MKVKCIKSYGNKLTAGEVYNVTGVNGDCIRVLCDDGFVDGFSDMYLEPIPDTPQIEVGSEWISSVGDYTVKFIGDTVVVIMNTKTGVEQATFKELFGVAYLPKPKTVTMYFHKTKTGEYYAQETKCTGYLFTKEIDL